MMNELVRKSAVRRYVLGLFIFNLVVLALGLVVVKNYAEAEAKKKAEAVALATRAADRYNLNRTTCSLRALVEPLIAADRLTLKSYKQAADDPTAKPAARKRNLQRVIDTQVKIDGEVAYLAAYATIPPDFDCSSLPVTPPPIQEK